MIKDLRLGCLVVAFSQVFSLFAEPSALAVVAPQVSRKAKEKEFERQEFPDPAKINSLVDDLCKLSKVISGRANSSEIVDLVGSVIKLVCEHKQITEFVELSVSSAKIKAKFFKLAEMVAKNPDRSDIKPMFLNCAGKANLIFNWQEGAISTMSREMTDVEINETFISPAKKVGGTLLLIAGGFLTFQKFKTDIFEPLKKKFDSDSKTVTVPVPVSDPKLKEGPPVIVLHNGKTYHARVREDDMTEFKLDMRVQLVGGEIKSLGSDGSSLTTGQLRGIVKSSS